jgi:hypothetical protein
MRKSTINPDGRATLVRKCGIKVGVGDQAYNKNIKYTRFIFAINSNNEDNAPTSVFVSRNVTKPRLDSMKAKRASMG